MIVFCPVRLHNSQEIQGRFFFSFSFFSPPHDTCIIHPVVPVTDDVLIPRTEQT